MFVFSSKIFEHDEHQHDTVTDWFGFISKFFEHNIFNFEHDEHNHDTFTSLFAFISKTLEHDTFTFEHDEHKHDTFTFEHDEHEQDTFSGSFVFFSKTLKTTPILLNMMNMNTTPLPARLYLSKSKLENVVNLQYLKSSVLEITEPTRILS